MRIRVSGPEGVKRPFTPAHGQGTPEEQMAEAADHIARALSAIDHSLEVIVVRLETNSAAIARLAQAIEQMQRTQ
jgi:hypothetical protein